MAETEMIAPMGTFTVVRPNTMPDSPLRGWSAADLMALDHLDTDRTGATLIVNDEFGALTVGLARAVPIVWSDSLLSRAATDANLQANGLPVLGDRAVTGDAVPRGEFDTVVIKVPKTLQLLEAQLDVVASVTTPHSRIVGVGMTRHIHRSTIAAFEDRIGPTVTTRAERKARLILATNRGKVTRPSPRLSGTSEFTTDDGTVVCELPGTFSRGHVDVGTALLLETIAEHPEPADGSVIADLGCGNGVIGTTLARRWPQVRLVFTDVSDLAVTAARATWQRNGLADGRASFAVADGLGRVNGRSLAMVVSNPPFHQGHALDRELTDRLLADAARALASDGTAFVVVQRHLHVHERMRQWFGSVEVRSKHPTHVVLEATRPKKPTRTSRHEAP